MDFLLPDDLTAFKKLADACCCLDLSLMRADFMHLRVERLDAAVISFERHRSDLVCPI